MKGKWYYAFREFIRSESNREETFFFVYGNADNYFIKKIVAKIINNKIKAYGKYYKRLGKLS